MNVGSSGDVAFTVEMWTRLAVLGEEGSWPDKVGNVVAG